uniref:Small ribosomal subunit protein uS8c n=2 Tax=Ophioglossum TaxID=13833 RepID=L7T143_9MONI|nr:ribosomal protein S8 [Ophioglossum californicum]AGC26747.1 ribosomal protein S8 [Ophioglossum californicum]QXF60120.1 ribosomal protein S8 [Ophioglossum vulgatum]
MSNDTIANMITSIRNANMRKNAKVRVPATGTNKSIVKILFREGFIENVVEQKENNNSFITLTLRYRGRKRDPYITALKRISKPGLRIYLNHREVPEVLGGMGIIIISTPFGIMTDCEARQKRIGGEILCCVW